MQPSRVQIGSIQAILLACMVQLTRTQYNPHKKPKQENVVAEMQVVCHSDSILLKMNTNTPFNGMVYAKDAPNGNGCMAEYSASTNMTYRLPLKSCGTLHSEVDDGIEYFNTIVVQPHMRLMTNQGRGYHIRCKYQTRERTIANTHFNVSASFVMQNSHSTTSTPLLATASMPSCTMKIFRSGRDDVAEAVKIGDKLIMVIEIDQQDMYGMRITNCIVRDGLNMAEQLLINDLGCPVDENIMPKFDYTNNSTRAAVSFPAHKFPHTSSVYYQCNVRLCINNGGCESTDCSSGPSGSSSTGRSGSGGISSSSSSSSSGSSSSSSSSSNINNVIVNNYSNSSDAAGNPRRKRRYAPGELAAARQRSAVAKGAAEPLPKPSPLSSASAPSTAGGNSGAAASDVSFDVYSGLYVSDIDVGGAGSGDPSSEPSSSGAAARRHYGGGGGLDGSELCMSPSQASAMLVLVSSVSVAVVMMLLCQLGMLGWAHREDGGPVCGPNGPRGPISRRHGLGAGSRPPPTHLAAALASSRPKQQMYQHYMSSCDTLDSRRCS